MLCNVIVSGYFTFKSIKSTDVAYIYYFFIIDKMSSWGGFGPRVVVWRPLLHGLTQNKIGG